MTRRRTFGRLGWQVSEVGYGMWGVGGQTDTEVGGWNDSNDEQAHAALQLAVANGINFFDTALAYGDGHSERLLGELIDGQQERLYTASKIPPLNLGAATSPHRLRDSYPPHHIRASVEQTLANLHLPAVDLIQFHTWSDSWAGERSWQRAITELRDEGLIGGVGISVNRWEPWNVIETLRTGAIDSVQVVYNIFEQGPEDELLPLCDELQIAVIARVPFDEGALTGTLSPGSTWPDGDWRRNYFTPPHLAAMLDRIDALGGELPAGTTLAEIALRFVLSNSHISTVIAGMRRAQHVTHNTAAAARGPLDRDLLARLKRHRWDRTTDIF